MGTCSVCSTKPNDTVPDFMQPINMLPKQREEDRMSKRLAGSEESKRSQQSEESNKGKPSTSGPNDPNVYFAPTVESTSSNRYEFPTREPALTIHSDTNSPREMPFSPPTPTEPDFVQLAPEPKPLPGGFKPPPRPSLVERPRRTSHWSELQRARTQSS